MLADLPRESPERDEPIIEATREPVEKMAVTKETEDVQSEEEDEVEEV